MKKLKLFFAISIALNVILVSLFFMLDNRLGGTKYLIWRATIGCRTNGENLGREDHFKYLNAGKGGIIFFGDSMTSNAEWAELLENSRVKNRGIRGEHITHMLKRIDETVSSKPDKLFLMAGINDLICDPKETVAKNLEELILDIRKRSPDTKIYVESLLPINNTIKKTGRNNKDIKWVDSKLAAFCKNNANIVYINLYDIFADEKGNLKAEYTYDGGHLNGAGYLKWKEVVAPYCN